MRPDEMSSRKSAVSPARGRSRSSSRSRAASSAPASPARGRSPSRTRTSTPARGKSSKRKTEEEEVEEVEQEEKKKTTKAAKTSRSRSRGRAAQEAAEDEQEPQEQPRRRRQSAKRAEAEDEPIPVRGPVRTRSRSRARESGEEATPTKQAAAAPEPGIVRKEVRTASEAEMKQFGGPLGCLFIMIFSHLLVYYFYVCLQFNKGSLILPTAFTKDALLAWGKHIFDLAWQGAQPTLYAAKIYWVFWVAQGIMAVTLPGVTVEGYPIPSENNRKLKYLCNAVAAWYASLLGVWFLHSYNYFRITEIVDNMGPLITVAILSANFVAIMIYVTAFAFDLAAKDRSGNPFYDFFLGVWLNPRIGKLDLKMFAEVRVSWIMLFFITLSAAVKQYEVYGYVSTSMWFMVIAHFLYTNAIMKGEDCIPTTWDIFHEKWGWMLIFWNMAGVPFVYTAQSVFILRNSPAHTEHSSIYNVLLFTTLFIAYYVWDTTNSQKNRFRMQLNGSYVPRPWAIPQLPWGTLENPKYIETKAGSPLLIDGWYKYARKLHYTVDIIMALTWALSCGTCQFIPWFYVCFFTSFLIHRVHRDEERCSLKYADDWKKYVDIVPYRFIPGVY